MTAQDLKKATISDMTNAVDDVSVDTQATTAATGQKETEYQTTTWTQNHGYYRKIPECKIVVDTLARWIIGDGFIADPETTVILDHITGWGTDYFDDILENMIRTMLIDGDAYAEVIRDEKSGVLLNLKVLDPSTVKVVVDEKGIIKRYEQTAKIPVGKNKSAKIDFKPYEIFHLSRGRIADEIHGISIFESLKETIEALNESMVDTRKLMHHQVRPFILWKLKTDDTTTINHFKSRIDAARNLGEDMFIPDDTDAVEHEVIQTPISNGIFSWREDMVRNFYRNCGIPQILVGNASEFSESSSKIVYLSFARTCEQEQRYIVTQIWNQLYLRIDLPMPESIKNDMITDEKKDGSMARTGFQPNETEAGVGE